jgi:hypothetical protein
VIKWEKTLLTVKSYFLTSTLTFALQKPRALPDFGQRWRVQKKISLNLKVKVNLSADSTWSGLWS